MTSKPWGPIQPGTHPRSLLPLSIPQQGGPASGWRGTGTRSSQEPGVIGDSLKAEGWSTTRVQVPVLSKGPAGLGSQ